MENKQCSICNAYFSTKSNLNRHLKLIHGEEILNKYNIKCCLCCNKDYYRTYEELIKHLQDMHYMEIKIINMEFLSYENFEEWKCTNEIDVNYVLQTTSAKNPFKTVYYYNCNRTNTAGYKSQCEKYTLKSGGSIKIAGTCPSRVIANLYENGIVKIKFVETHVGHEKELRTQHLSKENIQSIVDQLKSGVNNNRILDNARKIENNKLTKLNLLNKKDLNGISRRFNIENYRHKDDMVATALKVEELNAKNNNTVFLFKRLGQPHSILKETDFAIGFMNSTMERKLKEFSRIICMDGTHGITKYKGYELTTILVKDNLNCGFPVAFMVSNRRDQLIQEVFLGSLKEKIGDDIICEYFMTDDDRKYYNAWIRVMGSQPKRLLCTWHVIKNRNIQGRMKIKNKQVKADMKNEMRKLLTELSLNKFNNLTEKYFEKLEKEDENEFLTYLKQYYFNSEERIQQWAHCYRLHAGINTNMALESLNRYLKEEKLNRKCNIRIEKLLDVLEEIVEDKMWKRIISVYKPHHDSYQARIIVSAHKKAKNQNFNSIEEIGLGKFKVPSFTGSNFYIVTYNMPCDCKSMYCQLCEICVHRYLCEYSQNAVKATICKHVHLVAMFERERQNSFSAYETEEILENNILKVKEIDNFITDKNENLKENNVDEVTIQNIRFDIMEEKCNYILNKFNFLDSATQNKVEELLNAAINVMDGGKSTNKRKMDCQSYYPHAKRKK